MSTHNICFHGQMKKKICGYPLFYLKLWSGLKLFDGTLGYFSCFLYFQGIKPFECDVCHNKFSSNVGLQEHKSRHTDAKPHKCPHCPKHFRQISCLRRHVLTHSSDKPFGCNVCQQRFSQMAYLKSHMKVHTGKYRKGTFFNLHVHSNFNGSNIFGTMEFCSRPG